MGQVADRLLRAFGRGALRPRRSWFDFRGCYQGTLYTNPSFSWDALAVAQLQAALGPGRCSCAHGRVCSDLARCLRESRICIMVGFPKVLVYRTETSAPLVARRTVRNGSRSTTS